MAAAFLEEELTAEHPGYINAITLAELVWTLRTSYEATDTSVVAAVERLLQADALVIQNVTEVRAAINDVADERGSFPDALIGRMNAAAGCSTTVSFDKKALRLETFTPLHS